MKACTRSVIIAILLLSCTAAVSATPAYYLCGVLIERAMPDELILKLWSTSQSTAYSVDINYAYAACLPWDGHERNWIIREELVPGFYILPWAKFYDRRPEPGMEACINWTCQPEVAVIYWSQDYRTVLDYLFLPFVERQNLTNETE